MQDICLTYHDRSQNGYILQVVAIFLAFDRANNHGDCIKQYINSGRVIPSIDIQEMLHQRRQGTSRSSDYFVYLFTRYQVI